MVLMARKGKVSKATPWGYYFESLVSSRHYDNLTQFSDDLRENGRGVTPQMMSKYKSSVAPLWFIADSIDVLDLDDGETNKYVGLWLDTLPPDERAVHQRMAALLLKGGGGATMATLPEESGPDDNNEIKIGDKRSEYRHRSEEKRRSREKDSHGLGDTD